MYKSEKLGRPQVMLFNMSKIHASLRHFIRYSNRQLTPCPIIEIYIKCYSSQHKVKLPEFGGCCHFQKPKEPQKYFGSPG